MPEIFAEHDFVFSSRLNNRKRKGDACIQTVQINKVYSSFYNLSPQHLYISLAEKHIQDEEEAAKRPLTKVCGSTLAFSQIYSQYTILLMQI